jgi:hypothetical protein
MEIQKYKSTQAVNISAGNTTLYEVLTASEGLFFQAWYSNIVATDVKIEVWVSIDSSRTFAKIDEAGKTLAAAADGSVFISLSGLKYTYVQFRLAVGAGVAGSITAWALNT